MIHLRLLDVSEVSLCTYEAIATTPGACEVDLEPEDDELVLMPHDEFRVSEVSLLPKG